MASQRDRLIAAGAYRHRVTVQAPTAPAADGDGGYTPGWTDANPPTWAVSVTPAARRDGEVTAQGTTVTTASHLVRGRYRPDVTTQTQLVLEGRALNVLIVRDLDERHRVLELVCAEYVP